MADNRVFPYEATACTALRSTLSAERFDRYLGATGGNEVAACQLYTWNTAVSAALYGPLQACEIAVRNAVDTELSRRYGRAWFDQPTLLGADELRISRDAQDGIRRRGAAITLGAVVAELGFGFWVGLFARRHDATLWRSSLFRAFSPRPPRADVFEKLDRLRTLRNRVAHHEPIFQRDLRADVDRILDVLGMLSPDHADWVRHHSRADVVLRTRPDVLVHF
ncbi:MAG: hypothetical protein ACT4OX_06035 [Actinomycetota bacterium]